MNSVMARTSPATTLIRRDDTAITFGGYTGSYGQPAWVVAHGDEMEIQVGNPQSGKGPASCAVMAGSGGSTGC